MQGAKLRAPWVLGLEGLFDKMCKRDAEAESMSRALRFWNMNIIRGDWPKTAIEEAE